MHSGWSLELLGGNGKIPDFERCFVGSLKPKGFVSPEVAPKGASGAESCLPRLDELLLLVIPFDLQESAGPKNKKPLL